MFYKKLFILSTVCFLATSMFLFSSCTKEDINPVNPTLTDVLQSSNWQLKSKIANCQNVDVEQILSCEKDNIFEFHANGKLELNPGLNSCPWDGLQPADTWVLDETNKILMLIYANIVIPSQPFEEEYKIINFNSGLIKMVKQTPDYSNLNCSIWDWKEEWIAVPK